jgi:dCTP deaminase
VDKLESLTFEIVERLIRMYEHIDRSCTMATVPGARANAQLKIASEIQEHLVEVLGLTLDNLSPVSTLVHEEKLSYLYAALEYLSTIHVTGLVRIPRPHEPVEVVSYLRQTLMADGLPEGEVARGTVIPDIFATEGLGNHAHYRFGLASAKHKLSVPSALRGSLVDFAIENGLEEEVSVKDADMRYISLPRIDLGNPCKWPSLMHEVGHFRSPSDILLSLAEAVGEDYLQRALVSIKPFCADKSGLGCRAELAKWLLECWCDAYAVIMAGPAAYFAQLHAFIFSHPIYLSDGVKISSGYPPAWFRLKLLLTLSEARLDIDDEAMRHQICATMENEKRSAFEIFDVKVEFTPGLAVLQRVFSEYLRVAFPRDRYKHSTQLSSVALGKLVADLRLGLPVPSLTEIDRERNYQRAATPAEILLAGWLYRCSSFKSEFLDVLRSSGGQGKTATLLELVAKVARSDETLKRSIQMSEWFKILSHNSTGGDAEDSNLPSTAADPPLNSAGLLSDVDIHRLLRNESLRIIPLIDAERQIRGSVIDLRLGHNFEIFYSNVPRIVDPLRPTSVEENDSMEVDVDFSKSIKIGPGQFVLAHTLEYIKLPPSVAAQIEGRSSFARLGLQVHMTANLVEAGFEGCLTLEILNSGPSTITLYPGMRIAQIRLFRFVTTPKYPYGQSGENKYRGRLSHNKAQQFSDWEVLAIEAAKRKFRIE